MCTDIYFIVLTFIFKKASYNFHCASTQVTQKSFVFA